ncbi:MAG: LuxR C-terminal-related transcriptional regulator [Labedaea sp.]
MRERLHALLDEAVVVTPAGSPVPVVCAPAGAGKTTMLATWLRGWVERGNGCAAWVSLDAEDNDPTLLWSAILRALQLSGAWQPGRSLDRLMPPSGQQHAAFLAAVIAAFDRSLLPVVLVLDGVHEVQSSEAVRSLNFLLRHTPAALRIVLAARCRPQLNLARLRLEGRLREIDPGKLPFSGEEARHLYAGEGIRLDEADLHLLMERTEGWPAGLRFAAMTVHDRTRPANDINGFTGDQPAVAEYLLEEVLARQRKDVQHFMLSTSLCRSFTVGLAEALSGLPNVGQILDWLERSGILVCDRDRSSSWYHYHPLLSRCLRTEFGRREPAARHELHRTAAHWFRGSGDSLRAIVHAIASRDDDLTSGLVDGHGLEQILKGHAGELGRILDTAPESVLARPTVALIAAEAALDLGDLPAADRWLHRTNDVARRPNNPRLSTLLTTVRLHRARLHGDVGGTLALLESWPGDRSGDPDVDLLALFHRGVAAAWTGKRHAASKDLRQALDQAIRDRRDGMALHCEVHLAAEGDLTQLNERAGTALEFAKSRGWAETPHSAYLHTLLAVVAYQRLEDLRVLQWCTFASNNSMAALAHDPTIAFAQALRALVIVGRSSDPNSIVTALQRLWQGASDRGLSPVLVAYLAPACQRMALRAGNRVWAVELLEQAKALLAPCGEQALLRATLHAHNGKPDLARRLLASVLDGQNRAIVIPTLIDAWLLEAHLAHRAEELDRAHQALAQALAIAAPQIALRPFQDAGPWLRALLAAGVGRFGSLDPFAAKVLADLPVPDPNLIDELTKRELDLLAELPSMRTAEEIADSWFVSVNTVKTHLRGIYRKFGVHRRRDAVIVARQRGLL